MPGSVPAPETRKGREKRPFLQNHCFVEDACQALSSAYASIGGQEHMMCRSP